MEEGQHIGGPLWCEKSWRRDLAREPRPRQPGIEDKWAHPLLGLQEEKAGFVSASDSSAAKWKYPADKWN